MKGAARHLVRRTQGIFVTTGQLIKQISERFVNALCSYQEANYHYQPPLFVSRIIRLITKLSPLETRFFSLHQNKAIIVFQWHGVSDEPNQYLYLVMLQQRRG